MELLQGTKPLGSGQLASLCDCGDPTKIIHSLPDPRFEAIGKVLESTVQLQAWSSRPRTYFILWQIKRLDTMDWFIAKGLNDTSLPYRARRDLPEMLTFYEASDFLKWQEVVVSDVLHLEQGKHVSVGNGDTLFEPKPVRLGVGSQGYVYIGFVILCSLCLRLCRKYDNANAPTLWGSSICHSSPMHWRQQSFLHFRI